MEPAATTGTVCVNAETWRHVKDSSRGESQGLLQIKGKGEMEIFRIVAA